MRDLEVSDGGALNIVALRYLDPQGEFAVAAARILGGPLPAALRVAQHSPAAFGGAPLLLAWRSPTETWLLTETPAALAALERATQHLTDGHCVDQTGGIVAIRVSGSRTPDLLCRLGSQACIPAPGAVLTGRLAELTVMSLCTRADEVTLLVERAYRPHLMGWIRATVADL